MKRCRLLLGLIVIYAASVRAITLNRPFDFDAEGSGSLNAVLARSYLRFDWHETHGMPVLSLDPNRAPTIVFYPDHPPLIPLTIALSYKIFGVGDWQTRLPIALMTLGAILALHRLVAVTATARQATVAAALFAATPMTLYFGGFADVVGMPLLFLSFVAILTYLRFHRAPGLRTYAPFAGGFALAGLCDWPAYVLVPVFLVHFAATRSRKDWPWIAAFAATAAMLFVALFSYITIATHYSWTWILPLLQRRSALVGGSSYTTRQWMAAALDFNRTYHTLSLLLVAAASIFWLIRRRPSASPVPWILLGWATLYVFIGSKALYDHEWAWCILTPALVVTASALVERLPSPAIAAIIVAFAAWTTSTTLGRLYPAHRDRAYTPADIADAIRAAAPRPNDIVLLVGNETPAQLWWYADRPLRAGIWSVDDFERRLDENTVDLMFNFDELPWRGRATGIVFPRIWLRIAPDLLTYVAERYDRLPLPAGADQSFEVFDLRAAHTRSPRP
jgi:dolichyl-phosphate-mannose-protein mannosyltransferase